MFADVDSRSSRHATRCSRKDCGRRVRYICSRSSPLFTAEKTLFPKSNLNRVCESRTGLGRSRAETTLPLGICLCCSHEVTCASQSWINLILYVQKSEPVQTSNF